MAQGYLTVERWVRGKWAEAVVLPSGATLTEAEGVIEGMGKAGFYRVVEMRRVVWAESEAEKMRLRKSHATSPKGLGEMVGMYERTKGKYPVEEVRAVRREAKKRRGEG